MLEKDLKRVNEIIKEYSADSRIVSDMYAKWDKRKADLIKAHGVLMEKISVTKPLDEIADDVNDSLLFACLAQGLKSYSSARVEGVRVLNRWGEKE